MRPSRHPPLLASRHPQRTPPHPAAPRRACPPSAHPAAPAHPQRTPPRLPTLSAPRERMGARTASLCTTTLPTAGPSPHPPTSPPRRPTKCCCRAATCACAPRASRASSSSARSAASRAPRRTPSTPDRHAPRRQEKTRSAKIVCKDSRVPTPARARAAASCAAAEQPPPPRAPVAPDGLRSRCAVAGRR